MGVRTKLAAGDGFGRSSECQNREDVSHPKRQNSAIAECHANGVKFGRKPSLTTCAKRSASIRNAERAYAPRTAKGPIETPEPTPKMVEMAAKQTIVEEIVRNAY